MYDPASRPHRSWRGRENRQDEQPLTAGVPDAVRHTLRRHDELAGFDRQLATLEQDHAFAFDDLVDLVHRGVRMKGVKLARLETIEADEQPRRLEEGALAHLVGPPFGAVGGPDDRWMFHDLSFRFAQRMT